MILTVLNQVNGLSFVKGASLSITTDQDVKHHISEIL